MAVDGLAAKLELLLSEGRLSYGRLTSRERDRLQGLFDAEVLQTERSGSGKKVVIKSYEALRSYVIRNYPSGLAGETDAHGPRSRSVAELRDSKKAREIGPQIALLRGFDDCQLLSGDRILQVAHLTDLAGVVALRIDENSWEFSGTIAIVENLEVFWHFEKLGVGATLALYAQGRLSGKIVNWLASLSMREARLIHCGDYDPVGIDEYLKLKAMCPERVQLYLPSNLEVLFSKYGKSSLLSSSEAVLARLRASDDDDARKVVSMMDRYGVGLEQEALLLTT